MNRNAKIAGFVIAGLVAIACTGQTPRNEPGTVDRVTAAIPDQSATTPAEPAPPPQQPVTVTGVGNNVVQIGATLNGAFTVAYSTEQAGGFILDFLRADGSSAAGFMEGVNELNFDGPISGSKVVTLDDASMVQASNVDGPWTVTFTPLG